MPSVAFYTGYFAVFKVNQYTAIAGTKGATRLFNFLADFRGTHFFSFKGLSQEDLIISINSKVCQNNRMRPLVVLSRKVFAYLPGSVEPMRSSIYQEVETFSHFV
jgi:hypothetical protein